MFIHTLTKWVNGVGFGLKTRFKRRKRRSPPTGPNAPVTFVPDVELRARTEGITCGEAACARPVPAKNHADARINGYSGIDATNDLFRAVHRLEKYRSRRY